MYDVQEVLQQRLKDALAGQQRATSLLSDLNMKLVHTMNQRYVTRTHTIHLYIT